MFNPFTHLLSNHTSSCICAILSSSTGKHTHTQSFTIAAAVVETAPLTTPTRKYSCVLLCARAEQSCVPWRVLVLMEHLSSPTRARDRHHLPGNRARRQPSRWVGRNITLTAPQTRCGFWWPKWLTGTWLRRTWKVLEVWNISDTYCVFLLHLLVFVFSQ